MAQTLNSMRIEGTPLPYSNGVESRTVVISEFTAYVHKFNWIEYEITVVPGDDAGGGGGGGLLGGLNASIDSLISNDLGSALGSVLPDFPIGIGVASLGALQTAAAGLSPITSAISTLVGPVLGQAGGIIATGEQTLASVGAVLDLPDPLGFPASLPGALGALSAAANDSSNLSDMRGYLGRAAFNISQARA